MHAGEKASVWHCGIPQDHVSLLLLAKNAMHLPSSCMIIDLILARVCLFTAKAKYLQIAKNVVNEAADCFWL